MRYTILLSCEQTNGIDNRKTNFMTTQADPWAKSSTWLKKSGDVTRPTTTTTLFLQRGVKKWIIHA